MSKNHLRISVSENENAVSQPNSPIKMNETSNINIKMMSMRERFKMLQMEEPDDGMRVIDEEAQHSPVEAANTTEEIPGASTSLGASAANRWSKLRKVIRTDSSQSKFFPDTTNLTPRLEGQPPQLDVSGSIELEDIKLMEFWTNPTIKVDVVDEKAFEKVPLTLPQSSVEQDFDVFSKPVAVTVSRIPESVIMEQKERIQLSLYEEQSRVLESIKRKEVDVIWREHLARERLAALEAESKRRIDAERLKVMDLSREKEALLGRDFRKVREELEAGLKRQQGAVRENFGQVLAHEESISRRFQVFSRLLPQPVEVRIHLLRAVKTKLRKGAYVLMLTQYDSLGGRPLSWSQIGVNGIGSLRPGITKVFKHYGRYFDRTLRVEDSCFALCPPRPLLRPSFVFVLELFELASRHNPSDRIVGWSAVPMSYESMTLIEGKIKLPFLRGEHSPAIQHFKDMENCMARSLNNWLCNGYLEVRHMSLNELGADEALLKSTDYDMDYFNKVLDTDLRKGHLSSPTSRQATPHGALKSPSPSGISDDIESGIQAGSSVKLVLPVDKGMFRRKNNPAMASDSGLVAKNAAAHVGSNNADVDASEDEEMQRLLPTSGIDTKGNGLMSGFMRIFGAGQAKDNHNNGKTSSGSHMVLQKDESFITHRNALINQWKSNIKNKMPRRGGAAEDEDTADEVRERGYNVQDEVFLHRQQRGKLAGVETVDTKEGRQWSSAGLEGTIVRRWQSDGPRFDSEAISSSRLDAPDTTNPLHQSQSSAAVFNFSKVDAPHAAPKPIDPDDWQELRDSREMEDYSMSIASDPSRRKNLIPGASARSKLRYLSMELFGDLAPYMFGTFEFYATIFLFLFAFWLRIYVHYLAQYLYLESLGTPIFGFKMKILIVVYKYMSESITTSAEVGVVAIGPIANICIFCFLVFSGTIFYKFANFLPEVISKFFAAYGVATIFDPLLTLIVDLGYHNYSCKEVSDSCRENYVSSSCDCFNGDFVKLWYRMMRIEGSGITGLFIMLLLYSGTAVLAALILYEYLVHIHRNGRILDIWRRINAPAEEFFIPHDYEVSSEELTSVCSKATQWRGLNRAKRKVVTLEGIERDPHDRNFLGRFKRYMIYEVEENGRNSVYRQFLMDASGMILEVFEDFKRAHQQRHLFADTNALANPKSNGFSQKHVFGQSVDNDLIDEVENKNDDNDNDGAAED